MIPLKDKRFFFRQITLTINLIWPHARIHLGFVSKSPTKEKISAFSETHVLGSLGYFECFRC